MTAKHSARKPIEIPAGSRFGKLVVVASAEKRGSHRYWKCLCNCGKETIVEEGNLRAGRTKSCGCSRITAIIVGTRYGKLVVLEQVEEKRGEGDPVRWKCRCDCGNETNVAGYRLAKGVTKSCGCLKYYSPDLLERLDHHVRVTENGCWIWGDGKDRHRITSLHKKQVLLHRAVYERFKGTIPDGMLVCHNCPGGDNRACCNPDHLWLGTDADNHRDAVKKGRTRSGERHWKSKLTNEQAQAIFEGYHRNGKMQAELAREYSVRPMIVWSIVQRVNWRRATKALAQELGIS